MLICVIYIFKYLCNVHEIAQKISNKNTKSALRDIVYQV